MPSENQNGSFAAGDDVQLTFAITDRLGASMDIASATWELREGSHTAAAIQTKTSADTAILTGEGTAWSLMVPLTHNDTDLEPGVYYQKVTVFDADGGQSTVSRGLLQIT